MSRLLTIAALAGTPFGLVMGLYLTVQLGSTFGVSFGLGCGLLFGLLVAAFVQWQRSQFTRENPCLEGEQLLKQGAANHFLGLESVGGWLYLTDQRLLFRSHGFNIQNHELSIPLEDIMDAQVSSTAWIVPNGLRVITGKAAERFVVTGRQSWVEAINHARRRRPCTPIARDGPFSRARRLIL